MGSLHVAEVDNTKGRSDGTGQNSSGRGRHNTGKDGKGTPAWSESKPSGIDIMVGGGRLTDNRHPSVQVHRGSTNMDLSRDDEGATQDRSNAPITTPHDPEQVSETKCCCFFKRKMRKKKSSRTK